MLHKQHHFLCNINYAVTAESMGKSLKYTTKIVIPLQHCMSIQCYCIIAHTAVCIVLLEIVYIDTAMEDVLIDTKQEAISYH